MGRSSAIVTRMNSPGWIFCGANSVWSRGQPRKNTRNGRTAFQTVSVDQVL